MTRDLRNFRSFQLNFRFCFALLIFQVQIISTQQIEQFWCLENYKLLVSAEKQLADPLFSSYSAVHCILYSLPRYYLNDLIKKADRFLPPYVNNGHQSETRRHSVLPRHPAAASAAAGTQWSIGRRIYTLRYTRYSSVWNRLVGRNKRAGGKILRKH